MQSYQRNVSFLCYYPLENCSRYNLNNFFHASSLSSFVKLNFLTVIHSSSLSIEKEKEKERKEL